LNVVLFAEAAAAFEELTLSGRANELRVQTPDAWPNLFREARFLSAVDFVQADRFRRKVAREMTRVMSEVDLLIVPSLRDEMLVISNNTGHPSLTLRTGFVNVSEARSDWAPDPAHPLPKFSPARRVPNRSQPPRANHSKPGSVGHLPDRPEDLQARGEMTWAQKCVGMNRKVVSVHGSCRASAASATLRGSSIPPFSRRLCSSGPTSSQYLIRIMPESTITSPRPGSGKGTG